MTVSDYTFTSAQATPQPHRVTPLYLADDLAAARRRYSALGFEVIETGDEGSIGLAAGQSGFMVMSQEEAARSLPKNVVRALESGPALYIWVDSLDAVQMSLADPIIAERITDNGTWELYVESRVGLVIFAEKIGLDTDINQGLSRIPAQPLNATIHDLPRASDIAPTAPHVMEDHAFAAMSEHREAA